MKQYFAYTRVSTVKQGEHGVSLQEQKSEIQRYAHQRGLAISEWFEERETAAKVGRTLFTQLMKRLRRGDAAGVIIHKIDRSARNLKDWAEIAELAEDGIEVHFTRESLDLLSSSGRLAADVQAVVAANYVRNLREETIKGLYGRLKQGIYPFSAPLGYLDLGRGKPKAIDPERGPLVSKAFSLYATGRFSQQALAKQMSREGLLSKKNKRVSHTTLAGILTNPFYYGLIRIKKGRQFFIGKHQPLISERTFLAVEAILKFRGPKQTRRHDFMYSRLIRCGGCGRSLVGEKQKNRVYYRCHTMSCAKISFREEQIDSALMRKMGRISIHPLEMSILEGYVARKRVACEADRQQHLGSVEVELKQISDRIARLTDVYIDGHLDEVTFKERKKALLTEHLGLERQKRELSQDSGQLLERLTKYVELLKVLRTQYERAIPEERRQLIENIMSNCVANGKTLVFTLRNALSEAAERPAGKTGDPLNRNSRFWEMWVDRWVTGDDEELRNLPHAA